MARGYLTDDVEAEAQARWVPGTCRIPAEASLGEPPEVARGDPRAVVDHAEREARPGRRPIEDDRDVAAGLVVPDGVVDDVAERLLDQGHVAQNVDLDRWHA